MAVLQLINGRGEALVDEADLPHLSRHRWYLHPGGYAMTVIAGKTALMHRLIINPRPGYEVDHANLNKLDNRRSNLRECSRSDNCRNTKPIKNRRWKGVVQDPRDGRWHAQIHVKGRTIPFCYTNDPEEAAIAYDKAARFHHGEFARTNLAGTEAVSAWVLAAKPRQRKKASTSIYRGVSRSSSGNRWRVVYCQKYVGLYKTEKEAAIAYDNAAFADKGDRALLNFRDRLIPNARDPV
jgi:hypothetical protein